MPKINLSRPTNQSIEPNNKNKRAGSPPDLGSDAIDGRDIAGCRALLQQGVEIENIRFLSPPNPKLQLFLNNASVVKQLDLKKAQNVSFRPLEKTLLELDFDKASDLLKQETKIDLRENTIEEIWIQSIKKNRPDIACAVLALSQPEWIKRLHENREDFDIDEHDYIGISLMHQAFRFGNKSIDSVIKQFPYSAAKHDLGENVNNSNVSFQNGVFIHCNALSAFWVHQRFQFENTKSQFVDSENVGTNKTKFDSSVFRKKMLPQTIPDGFQHGLSDLCATSTDLHIMDVKDFISFQKKRFRALDEVSWESGKKVSRYEIYGVMTPTHALAFELKIQQDELGNKKYSRHFHDPNNRYLHTRVIGRNSNSSDNWTFPEGLQDEDAFESSFPNDERIVLIFRCDERQVNALAQKANVKKIPEAQRKVVSLPEGDNKFTSSALFLVLRGRMMGAWQDIQFELQNYALRTTPENLEEILTAKNHLGMPVFFHLIRNYPDAAEVYIHSILNLPITDSAKLNIIFACDEDDNSPFAQKKSMANMRSILTRINDKKVVKQFEDRLAV